MYEHLHFFHTPQHRTAVVLPFDLEAVVSDWSRLRAVMARQLTDGFSRDEWAYLITFLGAANLMQPFIDAFGEPQTGAAREITRLVRPRGPIAIWLPSNVSLLGPLVVVLLSLTGNPLRLKESSYSQNLTRRFLDFVREHLPEGPLATHLSANVWHQMFDRLDPRSEDMAAVARVRIVFGSDETVAAIDALPHPFDSVGIAFANRQSEAWLESAALSEQVLAELIKVFAVYGQAGCTSPRRLVLLDAERLTAVALRDRLLALWPRIIRQSPPAHVASSNVMTRQLAAARGWDATLTARNAAVLAVGDMTLPMLDAPMALPIITATPEEALTHLPANVQTIGHALVEPRDPRWLDRLAESSVKRFVPVGRMHHFGSIWDGLTFWRQSFEEVEVAQ